MKSPLDKRIRELEKELSQVDGKVRSLAKVVDRSRSGGPLKLPTLVDPSVDDRPPPRAAESGGIIKEPMRRPRDERFSDYLSSSLGGPVAPLRHERSQQRNKAMLVIAVLVVVLFWIVHRFFL